MSLPSRECLSGINPVSHSIGEGGPKEGDEEIIVDLLCKTSFGSKMIKFGDKFIGSHQALSEFHQHQVGILLFNCIHELHIVMVLVLDANRNESLRVRMTQAASLLLMQLVYRTSRSSSSIPSC